MPALVPVAITPTDGRRMTRIGLGAASTLPALFASTAPAAKRYWEFFTVNIRNKNTRRAYFDALTRFAGWCQAHQILDLADVEPLHVAGFIEELGDTYSKPTVKQHLAAVRMLFDWMVLGHFVAVNPATSVRGPKHSVRKGKTPVLSVAEMRDLLASIDTGSLIGLRDRALIAMMGYTFARVGAAVAMTVDDYYVQGRRSWVRLHEKGGKVVELPCHHNLDHYLDEWLQASHLGKGEPLFPTLRAGQLADGKRISLPPANVDAMIKRRVRAAGIATRISAHSFRATGITTYLENGGKLETAQAMAAHESARTTGLYDRRSDAVALDEIERIAY